MNKIFKIISVIFLFFVLSVNCIMAQDEDNRQKIRQGAFAKVMVTEEFSSLSADINDTVKFINTEDIFVYETKAIPKKNNKNKNNKKRPNKTQSKKNVKRNYKSNVSYVKNNPKRKGSK